MSNPRFSGLRLLGRRIATVESIGSILGWDQETYMPAGGAAFRADQAELIAALAHERRTSREYGDALSACEQDRSITGETGSPAASAVREMRRRYDRAVKLPTDLVAELARVGTQAQEVWKKAREDSDFAMFAPWLERMMDLTRRKAECYGVPAGGELYDALLDEYEPGATARQLDQVFGPLATRLAGLVGDLSSRGTPPVTAPLEVRAETSRQHELGKFVLGAIGFDLSSGRLDVTTHPFCSGLGPGDTRLTTRYRERAFTDALYGTLHEGGHGLYEQGLPKGATPDWLADGVIGRGGDGPDGSVFGTPLADAVSLGIHESQSRMWENFVGRSRAFWGWLFPYARLLLSPSLDAFGPEDLYRAVNTARPSLIRVEADEATYNLHILLRFEMERGLISGRLRVRDLPGEWNGRFRSLLGLEVPDDRRGCLQDVHWSFGLIGYFPTYTLGNLYAAQLWEAIRRDLPDLDDRLARGDFSALLNWLRDRVHRHGSRYTAAELCQRATGSALSADPLMRHLESRLRPIYGGSGPRRG